MSNQGTLFRQIPKVDELLKLPAVAKRLEGDSRAMVVEAVRQATEELREEIKEGRREELPTQSEWEENILNLLEEKSQSHLRRVINGTGIILHTNLGRACLAPQAMEAVEAAASHYSNLEYDLEQGTRGSRYSHVTQLLKELTGAEDAMVVNNNAAAVLLILSSLTKGGEVIISRGELVEIGGSFRVPAIMEQSGSHLVEVGTTNKTHFADYEQAIDPERTVALLKVHTSNFRVMGFTQEVPLADLVRLGHAHNLPVIHDLGSGALVSLEEYGIKDEPTVQQSMQAGVDVLSFSGDKLLGGPQAGIILGKAQYIAKMKKHPLTRALRIDKMTLAALEATLRLYRDREQAVGNIPLLKMLSQTRETLTPKAELLAQKIAGTTHDCTVTVMEEFGQVGGGSVPTQMLPSMVVAIRPHTISPDELESRLRHCKIPVVGRISHDRFLLDVRTIEPEDFDLIGENLKACLARP